MKLLVTGLWFYFRKHEEEIRSMGYEIYFIPTDDAPLPDGLKYEDIEGVIGFRVFSYHPLEKFTNLKFVQLTSVGIDHVNVSDFTSRGIVFRHAPGSYAIPMAEYTIMRILEFLKKMEFVFERQKNHEWYKDRSIYELYGKNVLIIGFGDYGRECAKRLIPFGVNISCCNRTIKSYEGISKWYPLSDLNIALADADVVLLTVASTKETHYLLSDDQFNAMKNTAFVMNATRGETLDTKALIKAINEKKIAGAILDVFEEEPLPSTSPLWDLPNVLISSHNSFVGDKNDDRLWAIFKNTLMENKRD